MRSEQERARDYLHRKGTLLAPHEIYDRVRVAFAATEDLLAGVSEAEARVRPAPGQWCVQEIADHLVETHRPSVEELRYLLRGQRPPAGPVLASLQSRAPLGGPWPGLLEEMKRLHREILELLAGIPDGFSSETRAPVVLVVTVKSPDGSERPVHWVEEVDWKAYAVIFRLHEIDHLKQAERALEAVR